MLFAYVLDAANPLKFLFWKLSWIVCRTSTRSERGHKGSFLILRILFISLTKHRLWTYTEYFSLFLFQVDDILVFLILQHRHWERKSGVLFNYFYNKWRTPLSLDMPNCVKEQFLTLANNIKLTCLKQVKVKWRLSLSLGYLMIKAKHQLMHQRVHEWHIWKKERLRGSMSLWTGTFENIKFLNSYA